MTPEELERAVIKRQLLESHPVDAPRRTIERAAAKPVVAAGLTGAAVAGGGALAGMAGMGPAGVAAVEGLTGLAANRVLEAVGGQEPSGAGDIAALGLPMVGRGITEGTRALALRTRGGRALRGHAGAEFATQIPVNAFAPQVQRMRQLYGVLDRVPVDIPTTVVQTRAQQFSPRFLEETRRILRQADTMNQGLEAGFDAMLAGRPVRIGTYERINNALQEVRFSRASPTATHRQRALGVLTNAIDEQIDAADAAGVPGIRTLRAANDAGRRVFASREVLDVFERSTTPQARGLQRIRIGGQGGALARFQNLGIRFNAAGEVILDRGRSSLARSLADVPGAREAFGRDMAELERLTVHGDLFVTPGAVSSSMAGVAGGVAGQAIGGPAGAVTGAAAATLIPQQIAEIMVSPGARRLFLQYLRLSGGRVNPSILASLGGMASQLPVVEDTASRVVIGPSSQERLRQQGQGTRGTLPSPQ